MNETKQQQAEDRSQAETQAGIYIDQEALSALPGGGTEHHRVHVHAYF